MERGLIDMDAIVILILSIVFVTLSKPEVKSIESDIAYEVLQRPTKLNEDFYDDPNAFRRIVNELGF